MSIEYVRASDYKGISFSLDNSFPELTVAESEDVDVYWQAKKANNPSIFNGQIYCCHSYVNNDGQVSLGINRGDYATYSYMRGNNIKRAGTYSSGNCMFVFDPNRQAYVFVQRGNTVFDAAKISAIGGVLDYKDVEMDSFLGHVESETLKELGEELHVEGMPTAISLLGFYVDTDTYKLEFAYKGNVSVVDFKDGENRALLEIESREMEEFYRKNKQNLEASTRNHLEYLRADL